MSDDYVMVPREPTPEMIDAARASGAEGTREELASDYRAMIAAAPPAAPAPVVLPPMPEPVAWRWRERPHESRSWGDWRYMVNNKPQGPASPTFQMEPLYAAPPAAPAPVVPFDFLEWHGNLMMLADAYWESSTAARHRYREQLRTHALNAGQHWKARAVLSAAPVVREPLTDEQVAVACGWKTGCKPLPQELWIARAVEKAHGIGGGNG